MKVLGKVPLEFEIDNNTVKNICIDKICQIYGWDKNYFICAGNLMIEREYHSSHSWSQREIIRKANEEDAFLVKLISDIRKS